MLQSIMLQKTADLIKKYKLLIKNNLTKGQKSLNLKVLMIAWGIDLV